VAFIKLTVIFQHLILFIQGNWFISVVLAAVGLSRATEEAQKSIKQINKATNFVFHILNSYDPLTQNFGTEELLLMSTFMNSTCNIALRKKIPTSEKTNKYCSTSPSTNLRSSFCFLLLSL